MSVSETTSSLRAFCFVPGGTVSPIPIFQLNRGFLSIRRYPGEPLGVYILEPDAGNGFSPEDDTITLSFRQPFFPAFPGIYSTGYYDFSAVKPNGQRDLIVVTHRTSGLGPGVTGLSDEAFTLTVDTVR